MNFQHPAKSCTHPSPVLIIHVSLIYGSLYLSLHVCIQLIVTVKQVDVTIDRTFRVAKNLGRHTSPVLIGPADMLVDRDLRGESELALQDLDPIAFAKRFFAACTVVGRDICWVVNTNAWESMQARR